MASKKTDTKARKRSRKKARLKTREKQKTSSAAGQTSGPDESFVNDDEREETSEGVTNDTAPASYELSAAQAMVLINTSNKNSNAGQTFFGGLGADSSFQDLRALLGSYSSTLMLSPTPHRIPIQTLVALSLNDYTCRANLTGRVRHSWGIKNFERREFDRPIYFAARGWSEPEKSEYESWKPSERLSAGSVFVPYHWESGETHVLTVRILSPSEGKSKADVSGITRLGLYVAGKDLDDVQSNNVTFLIWLRPELIITTLKELLDLPLLRHARPTNEQQAASGPLMRICNTKGCAKDGFLHVVLFFMSKSTACDGWIQSHKLADPMEETLRSTLIRDIADEGPQKRAQLWMEEYDRLLPTHSPL